MINPEPSRRDSELVLLKVFYSPSEAEVVHSLLVAFGVECFLERDDCRGQRKGKRLFVMSEDLARAQEILGTGAQESQAT